MKTIAEGQLERMHNPVHPGRFLRTEIIQAHALSVIATARIASIPPDPIQSIKCEGRPQQRDGLAFREGLRSRYRDADANAELLRHRANAQPGGDDQSRAVRAAHRALNFEPFFHTASISIGTVRAKPVQWLSVAPQWPPRVADCPA